MTRPRSRLSNTNLFDLFFQGARPMLHIRFGCLAVLVFLVGLAARELRAAPEPEVQIPKILTTEPIKPGPGDDAVRKLIIARYNSALAGMHGRYIEFLAGRQGVTTEVFARGADRLVTAGLALSDKPADQVAFREQILELMQVFEQMSEAQFKAGRLPISDLEAARYHRIDAELHLLQAKRKANPPKP
jgi:hypothetical protein